MAPPRIYCCSNGCLNSSVKRPELSFFKLPSEEERRNQWLELISREDLSGKKAKSYVVCEEHFHAHEILRAEHRKNLKKNSVPSLNLPADTHQKKVILVVAFDVLLKVDNSTQTTESDVNLHRRSSTIISRKRKLQSQRSKRNKRMKLEVNNQSRKQQKDVFYKLCDTFLTTEFAELVKTQVSNDPFAKKQYLSIDTEINEKVLSILKIKVDNMTDNEKICSVIVDAMDLRANVVYNTKEDKFIGFHEVSGIQTGDPATMALVVMLRGIVDNWQQPVGFALLSEYRDYEGTVKWMDKLIEKLCEISFDVRAIVSNMETDMYNMAKERQIFPEKPFFTLLKSRKLFYVFDAPNLLMMVRDSLLENEFNFQGRVANMDPVKQFYAQDKEKSCSLAPKLTPSHIDPNSEEKKDVRLAAQLLSNSVAAAILTYIDFYVIDESGRDTVKVIKLINDLFDLLNSTSIENNNIYKNPFNGGQTQVKLFNDAINLFRTLKLVDRSGRDVTSSAKFIEGFQITIGSVMLLLEDLQKKGIKNLRTKWLSTASTSKLFTQIKAMSGVVGDPTSRQFITAFRELYVRDLLKPSLGKDCSMEIAKLLTENTSSDDSEDEGVEQSEFFTIDESENNVKVKSSDYSQMELPEKNTVVYLSSYLLKRCSEKHKDCQILNSYIAPAPEQRIHNFGADVRYQRYRQYSNETSTSLMVVPYDDFIQFVETMEEEFRNCFKRRRIEKEVAATIYKEISSATFSPPCPCFPVVYLKKLFIRLKLFHTVQANNHRWRTSCSRRKFFTVPSF